MVAAAAHATLGAFALDDEKWNIQWFTAEPFPLGQLLNQGYLYEAVTSCLKQNPISTESKLLLDGLLKPITPSPMMVRHLRLV